MSEKKITHLEIIQTVINRMATNSFYLKGWSVTLLAGIFALSGKDNDKSFFIIAYIPLITFWCLDAYYLFQERLYRELYNAVRIKEEESIDFSMNTSSIEVNEKISFYNCFWSKTEISFYLPLIIISILVILAI